MAGDPFATRPTDSGASSPARSTAAVVALDAADRFATRAIHAGSHVGPHGQVVPSISLATTFAQRRPGEPVGPYDYTRAGNDNQTRFENAVAALELPLTHAGPARDASGAEGDMPRAVAFSSGSAATASVIQALVGAGGHLVTVHDVYGGTNRYLTRIASALGIAATFVDMSHHAADKDLEQDRLVRVLADAFQPTTRLVWIESPTNPTLRLVDVAAVARFAHSKGALVAVDNTFASPFYQRPLELGADLVCHSVTKYINGHSDVLLGVVVSPEPAILDKLRFQQKAVGAVAAPFDLWLAQRGLKTLELRMKQHGLNALRLARVLARDPRVDYVRYPGLPGPEAALAWRQLSREAREWARDAGHDADAGFPCSGMLTFRLRVAAGDRGEAAARFFAACRLFTLAESLGGIESLAELPAAMTHAGLRDDERAALGIDHALIRLSVGVESVVDLERDLDIGLTAALGPARATSRSSAA